MCDILKKMRDQMPYRLSGFNIFLAANMTIRSLNLSITIQAIGFFSKLEMAQTDDFC